MTPSLEVEPGPHWWEASALTTAPALHPRRPKNLVETFGRKKMATKKMPFFVAIFFRPFRLSLASAICPWVSEDELVLDWINMSVKTGQPSEGESEVVELSLLSTAPVISDYE